MHAAKPDARPLLMVSFVAGLVSLALELAAGRLLAPAFGTTELVWSAIIGMILLYISVGSALGGRLADRFPQHSTLFTLITFAGIAVAGIPLASKPLLTVAARGMAALRPGMLFGPFVVILALFAVPVTLLACVTPFCIRLAVGNVSRSGATVGWFTAASTLGSFIGTLLPNLLLIPALGTRRTFLLLSALALVTGLWGLFVTVRRRFWLLVWSFPVVAILYLSPPGQVKPLPETPGGFLSSARLIYEGESSHNLIQVVEDQTGRRYLLLNEGQGIHSIYTPPDLYRPPGDPLAVLTGGPWDMYLISPLFSPTPYRQSDLRRVLVIGLAAGTTPTQLTEVFGAIQIDGVEIDREVVRVGQELFGMSQPNLTVYVADGRTFLARRDGVYDFVAVDAYRLPYIPWQLTTVEFFRDVRDHLDARGVVAINVGHAPRPDGTHDWRLVDAMVATMRQVFPSAFVIEIPGSFNAVCVATMQPATQRDLAQNAANLDDIRLRALAEVALENLREPNPSHLVFTDDRAPVERLTHAIVLGYVLGLP